MSRPIARRLFALGLLSASVAGAGTVYIPLPGTSTVGSFTYETQVTVTNGLTQNRAASTFLIQTGQDGTKRTGAATPVQVPAGKSLVFRPDKAARGLLELSGPLEFQYSARLVGLGAAAGLGVELPVVTSQNLGKAGERLTVHGLLSKGSRTADLTIVNLGQQTATCTIDALRADGTPVVAQATITMPALGHRFFANVLGAASSTGIADVRVAATCTRDFYVYAQLVDAATGELAVLTPAASGRSILRVPGAAPECPAGAACFDVAGLVHKPTTAAPYKRLTFRPAAGTYSKIRLQMDVTHGGWWTEHPDAQHEIFWFVRNLNRDMFGYTTLRGPGGENNANSALLRHGIGLTHAQKVKVLKGFTAKPGSKYHYDYLYDTQSRQIVMTIQEDGVEVLRVDSAPNVNSITVASTDAFLLDIGFFGTNPDEAPTYNWLYEDLHLEFVP